jgi:hypothetical protein
MRAAHAFSMTVFIRAVIFFARVDSIYRFNTSLQRADSYRSMGRLKPAANVRSGVCIVPRLRNGPFALNDGMGRFKRYGQRVNRS